jgi:hypothetical protein
MANQINYSDKYDVFLSYNRNMEKDDTTAYILAMRCDTFFGD